MLVALDACSSGLALPNSLNRFLNEEELVEFRQLSIIENDVREKARNILVAGTKDQDALYVNGGIFTNALINGLKGYADMNNDDIIQFRELVLYVRNMTVAEARQRGERQEPDSNKYERYGDGEIMFLISQE
ncbi:hypothetical protein U14_01951 [Candidatus Moduliflexus flocculans]|uniref:Uncharacterized protein n=1 Tax=Candidatus Moduliflexus flocculans TaxID=1499966 RepID=A0A0S6VZP3_9BACT|nr:hypothetical protein U14_01951 [Candidatus Moduliflexus flocculans]